jgi:GT2 family glycosyltransferase
MIAALITAHNRRDATLACLRSLFAAARHASCTVRAIVVDDGSTDGTAAAIRAAYPDVSLVSGSGRLFWAGGMRLAEEAAGAGDSEYYLWLNDDVELAESALLHLLSCAGATRIVVGATIDPVSGELTYSGVRRRGRHPLHFDLVAPSGQGPTPVDAFNGNVVLVPRAVSAATGGIDASLLHRTADFDFALRARRQGFEALLAPAVVGTCARGRRTPLWVRQDVPRLRRLRALLEPRGVPPRPYARYLRRHGGRLWLVFWVAPYVRFTAALLPILGRAVPPPRLGPGKL